MSYLSPFSMMGAGTPGMASGMTTAPMGAPGMQGQTGVGPPGVAGQPGVPGGINVQAEISRINNNMMMFDIAMALAALGTLVTTCMFVRSIYKPAKGVHGGDSDDDMDSGDDDSDES